ncbi:ImmA/IrrE family metallo-endopeptidase [Micromonospora purpureochromogenes]|uniref:ImmA/IrrE family metallo-endopeptidase n=1 Tax=Micromonospora purpureochromogenes TaxID=47872 RepID=UPI00362C62CD
MIRRRRATGEDQLRQLRRQSEQALDALGLTGGFTFGELHERVERRRGRPVHLIPRKLPALAPHGLWVAGEQADYIFYAANASPVRQRLIIGHEYGHALFDDASPASGPDRTSAAPAPLARSSYDVPQERRAEIFGSLAVQRAESWSEIPVTAPADIALANRLAAALEGRRHP